MARQLLGNESYKVHYVDSSWISRRRKRTVWRSPRGESQASETYLDRTYNHFIFEYAARISRHACYKQRAINYDEGMADGTRDLGLCARRVKILI